MPTNPSVDSSSEELPRSEESYSGRCKRRLHYDNLLFAIVWPHMMQIGDRLYDLLRDYGLGVKVQEHVKLVTAVDSSFFDEYGSTDAPPAGTT